MNQQSLNSDHIIIRLEHMEALLLEKLTQIDKSLGKLDKAPIQAAPPATSQPEAPGQNWQMISARLSLLEENFGNICNTLGRLDQEFEMLRRALAEKGA